MKVILGINANHADSSACIIINDKLEVAIEEERLTRKKHYSGFPIKSIQECIKISKLKLVDITDVAFNTRPVSNIVPKSIFFLKNISLKQNQSLNRVIRKINLRNKLLENFNLKKNVKFHFIEHHLAHIASAYFPSSFKKSVGLSIDGSGDFVTCAIAKCENNKIKIVKKNYFPHSLGIFYHGMTQFLGYNNYGDEYKIMGLAAYGEPKYFDKIKDNLFENDKKNLIKLNLNFFNNYKKNYRYIADENLLIDQIFNEKLNNLFLKEMSNNKKEEFLKDFACSVQKVYEFYFNKIIQYTVNLNFSDKLVFSGGCALNSSANKILTEKKNIFNDVYINYAPGDNGGAIGAALIVANKNNLKISNLKSPYLGMTYNDDDISKILKNSKYSDKIAFEYYEEDKSLYEKISKDISESKVIGWFQGKMEFGPRALGNRSILADPRNPKMKDIINLKVKRRESFRPFAPVVLKDKQNEWFESNFENLYMSSISQVKKEKKHLVPAITQIDVSARLQSVDQNSNYKLSLLIEEFNKITKVPILLNTSFNENEPIVMKPEEAIDCILRNDLDYLAINNFIVRKLK